jgi:hypothetical protein
MTKTKGKDRKTGQRNGRSADKSQAAVKKSEKPVTPAVPEPLDFVEVRKNIATLVRKSANEIADVFIGKAKAGELAPAKYLFEAVGLYPPTEETLAKPENSLAYAMLARMGLPTDPVICEEGPPPVSTPSEGKPEEWKSESEGVSGRREDREDAVE